jgi:hypothetical protein
VLEAEDGVLRGEVLEGLCGVGAGGPHFV